MSKLRLFERLAALDLKSEDDNDARLVTTKQSICGHLEKLFNTSLGSVMLDQEYGLTGDATQVIGNRPPDPQLIAKRMLAQINRYEPRLSNSVVKMKINNAKDISVGFVIRADINDEVEQDELVVNGVIMANGNLKFENYI